VIIEGYEPPSDPRLTNFRVTPDPGVIEVNIQPSASWDELVERTTHLYEAAHLSRLCTEKFMLDGRHTGTGGGNHFVFGGAHDTRLALPAPTRPAAQPDQLLAQPSVAVLPLLRPVHRPDQPVAARRRGAQRFGLRTGDRLQPAVPPRPRRCRRRCAPWLIDRALRNLLIDATGNTHRAEFCIDKLYSPDGATGRLGCSKCAPSKCRRTRACRSPSSCCCAP
jgi:uncharacterized protein (DUF2126 family)